MIITECEEGVLAKLRSKQEEDAEVSTIKEQMMKGQNKEYLMKNGLLHKKLNGDTLIVVPNLMQNSIIRQAHERGHFGPDKTE